ncbi:MAG: hypothetical protein ACI9T8_000413 [Candidatus Saccharimonadales bacterium]|jgi:hypothetical protein
MALFNRNKQTTIAELEEYYQNQSKTSNIGQLVGAIVGVLLVVALLVALYFGTRWSYRQIVADTSPEATVSLTDTTNDAPITIIANDTADSDGTVTDEAATTTRSDEATTSITFTDNNSDITDIVGKNTEENIPDTGAGSLLIAIPVVATAIGYSISRKSQLK